ncbi:hypothetical protein EPO05_01575 [Patescibacteria group bacterium]|nr:MAG: hypothetical protein EPO05_01575 [Patescibacteria group bacterium]
MRILSLFAVLPVLMAVFAQPVIASEAESANTKIETQLVSLETTITLDGDNAITLSSEAMPDETFLSPEDMAREQKLSRWKAKQAHLNPPKGKFVINASAYTAAADECGKSDGITSSGVKVKKERTLACPPNFAFGTKIQIEGVGVRVCEDRGGAIKGNHIDIYVETKKEAFAFGRRNLNAQVIE